MPKIQHHSIRTYFKKVKHIKQEALAKAAGISPVYLSNMIAGRRNPKPEMIEKLNAALDTLDSGISAKLFTHRLK